MTADAGWYPVALSDGLERGTSTGTRLFGREVVVWRDLEGEAHAWEDRCPHRGMRLSLGFVRGNQIACLYHGWHYDRAGQCRAIPAHPQLTPPETIKVELYGCAERAGVVWVSFDKSADPSTLPQERAVTPVRSVTIDAPAGAVIAGLSAIMLPAFGEGASMTTRSATIAPNLFSVANDRDELMIAVQPIAADETALHITVAGGPEYRGAGQKHFSLWAENLRRSLEAPAPWTPAEYAIEAAP